MALTYFAMIMQMMPSIFDLIVKIENMVGPGQGPAKASLLSNTVSAVVKSDPVMVAASHNYDINSTVNGIATAVIMGLNDTGVFKHSAK